MIPGSIWLNKAELSLLQRVAPMGREGVMRTMTVHLLRDPCVLQRRLRNYQKILYSIDNLHKLPARNSV